MAQLRETVLEITVLMQSCQKQAVAGAARTGAQPGPRCPAGGTGRGGALPLSPHRGGYVGLKAGEVFSLRAEEFPHLAGREERSPPGSGLKPEVGEGGRAPTAEARQRGNPR